MKMSVKKVIDNSTVVWYFKGAHSWYISNALSPSFYFQFNKIIEGSIILRRISLLRTIRSRYCTVQNLCSLFFYLGSK
jgi:hypothetical protein